MEKDEYQKQLFDEGRQQSREWDKAILGASVALGTFSGLTWKFIPGGIDQGTFGLLWTSWLFTFLAPLCVIVSYGFSRKAIDQALDEDAEDIPPGLKSSKFTSLTAWSNRLALAFLILGVIAFLWFSWLNADRFVGHGPDQTSTQAP